MSQKIHVVSGRLRVKWFDSGRAPTQPPNPDYPDGIDLNMSKDEQDACYTTLPYPAKRIGSYVISCNKCGLKAVCTTAGRMDDPRSIIVPCKTEEV